MASSGARRTRLTRRGRIVAWTVGVTSAVVLGVAGVGAWVYQDLDGSISSADVDDKIGGDRPEKLSPGSKNILVVGSDSRDGANAKYGKDLTTMQSDTLMVLHVPANRKWATVVSFPRDSWVEIPACDMGKGRTSSPHHAKINEAFALGGSSGEVSGAAACSIKTIEARTGLRIDHFMSVDFQGFKGMVDALDGIEVCPEEAIHSKKARLDMEAGCQTVAGEEALGYVRVRYGVGNGSDIGRIGRQQEFMNALVEKAQDRLTSPTSLYGFLKSATKSLTTDPDMAGIKPLYSLASELQGIPSDRLTFVTVPNYPREADVPTDKANVAWQYPHATDLFAALAKDKEIDGDRLKEQTKVPLYASSVKVQVLNGTSTPGLANTVAGKLREAGLTVTGTGNAPQPSAKSEITYPAGQEQQAKALAAHVPGAPAPRAADGGAGVITLVVGDDLDVERIR
ncbi:LCP family protein [Streptomyces sp. NPDC004822]|uniref:LCP family protein n=1 Tax=Streptomyces sp. SS1-1 TaxID=2651869 RepID=UPI00178C3FE8|nr:LCP family protein [Streptomyces sp. SS1-1]